MPKRKQRDDPIRDYIEWTNHRYDPGYYLGGNVPPILRKSSLGPKGRRLSGIALAISGIMSVGSVASYARMASDFPVWELVFDLAVAGLVVLAAATLLRSAAKTAHEDSKRPHQ